MMRPVTTCLLLSCIMIGVSCNENSNTEEKNETETSPCTEKTIIVSLITSTKANCEVLGSAELTATGGELPYSFEILNQPANNDGIFAQLSAGSYNVKVTDAEQCSKSFQFEIEAEAGSVDFTVSQSESAGCGTSMGAISIEATGGTPPYMYSVDASAFGDNDSFSNLSAGTHEIKVKDSESCEVTKNYYVTSGVSYLGQIAPIIDAKCAIHSGCHVTGNSEGIPDFTKLANVQSHALEIKSKTQSGEMPREGSISQEQKDLLACWADDGALDN